MTYFRFNVDIFDIITYPHRSGIRFVFDLASGVLCLFVCLFVSFFSF